MSKPTNSLNRDRVECPRCHKRQTHRNGYNHLASGEFIRRWYCQWCDKSFQVSGQ